MAAKKKPSAPAANSKKSNPKKASNRDVDKAIGAAIDLRDSGDLEGAAKAFLAIAPLRPKDHNFPLEAGNIYLQALDRPKDAIPCYEQAIALLPNDEARVPFWLGLGLAHSLAGNDKKALATFSKAGKVDPTNVQTFVEFGKHHLSQRRHKDALEYFDTAIAHFHMQNQFGAAFGGRRVNPHVLALALMGKARVSLRYLRKDVEGMGAVRELLRTLDDDQRCVTLANELVEEGRPETARAVLAAVLKHAPQHREATNLLATLAKKKASPAKKTPAKKTPAKKTPAKKTPAKKAPAKKKTSAERAPRKR